MNADAMEHPSDEQLALYGRDEADQDLIMAIETHIHSCEECASKLHEIIKDEIRRSDRE